MSAHAELVRRANETFEAGDLVDLTRFYESTALLLSSPRGSEPIDALFFEPDEIVGDEPTSILLFRAWIPVDTLGRDGRLLWRAGAKIAR